MQQIPWKGGNVEVFIQGEGPVVLCIHCTGSKGTQWRGMANAIANTSTPFRIVAPNLGGVGATSDVPQNNDRLKFDTELVLSVAGLFGGRVHLVGHSYGGLLAGRLAMDNPGLFQTLTLVEPAIAGPRDSPDLNDPKVDVKERLVRFFGFAGPAGGWDMLDSNYRQFALDNSTVILGQIDAVYHTDTPIDSYARLTMPTLVVKGGDSPESLRVNASSIAREIPNCVLSSIEGAGHMMPVTHPDELGEMVARHLRANEVI